MTRKWIRINFLGLLCLLVPFFSCLYAQSECNLPILSSVSEPSLDGFVTDWLDFNPGQVSWEIEFGLKGFPRTQIPNIVDIPLPTYTFDGLESGESYEVYIRANCDGEVSLYNGPYFVNTVIDNNASCDLQFPITDNNCPSQDEFLITEPFLPGSVLGEDVFLESVDLIISHPWPADLSIKLQAPWGESVTLSSNNGRGIDNYGDPTISRCSVPVSFSDDACRDIQMSLPPFVGSFFPEDPISSLFNGNSPEGNWAIVICDRASGDLGQLNYAKLNFVSESCNVPATFRVSDIEATQVTVAWDEGARCEALELVIKRTQDPTPLSSSDFVICEEGSFTINNLEPNQEYELTVEADCGNTIFSPESCVISFLTACKNSILVENFDNSDLCESSCVRSCPLSGIWYNGEGDDADWIISEGMTPTTFTGPLDDVSGDGKYIYIESQSDVCPDRQIIDLFSDCLTVIDSVDCALSFDYHMFGTDVGTLEISYSLDEVVWNSIFGIGGSQGNEWQHAQITLPSSFEKGRLRITATKPQNASRGDIAIDNLKLLSLDTIGLNPFFADNDSDGFGDGDVVAFFCSETAPLGFVSNDFDCDDTNGLVNPDAVEIRCNQIDDNCNGDADDVSLDDLDYFVVSVFNESCLGTATGRIELQAENGQPPYEYIWGDGSVGPVLSNLVSDIYTATITDVGGCQLITEPIFVGFEDILVYSISSLVTPSCSGQSDGSLSILVGGGVQPLAVEWSNGDSGLEISNLEDGLYQATISDASNCTLVTDEIRISGPQVLTVGVVLLQDSECHQDNSGFIQLGIVGGTPPYDVLWSHGISGPIASNLEAGLFSATITDTNDCINVIKDLEISEPDSLFVSVTTLEQITCPDGDDSFVDIKVEGGTPPYSYFWSNGSNLEDQFGLESGIYSLTVSDFNSCSAVIQEIDISEPEPIEISVSDIINVSCLGSMEGAVAIDVIGGNGNYIFNWGIFDGEDSDENSLDNLGPGLYSVTVVDEFNCKSNAFSLEVVNEDIPIDVNIFLDSEIECHGDSLASLTASVADASLPLDFNWSSGDKNLVNELTDTIVQLISGSYNLTVTDGEGCVGVADSIVIESPTPILHNVLNKINNDCWNGEEGLIVIDVSGGISPYEVEWSNGDQTLSISNLQTGLYDATITDAAGCVAFVSSISVFSPDTLSFNASVLSDVEGGNGGEIHLEAAGGVPPYSYMWGFPISFVNGPSATELDAGEYAVTITDAQFCENDTTLFVSGTSFTQETNIEDLIQVYPIPANDYLNIQLNDVRAESIELISLNGQVLIRKVHLSESRNPSTLNVENMSSGIYILKIVSGQKTISKKVILL